MTKDDIIPSRTDVLIMAREAGFDHWWDSGNEQRETLQEHIERFAALIASRVAAHIRETEFKPDWNNYRQGFADGAAEEREACAKVLDEMAADAEAEIEPSQVVHYYRSKAAAIRARGETSSRGQA